MTQIDTKRTDSFSIERAPGYSKDMRWVRSGLIALGSLALLLPFQNCSETLPEKATESASLAPGPTPRPAPAPSPTPMPLPNPNSVAAPAAASSLHLIHSGLCVDVNESFTVDGTALIQFPCHGEVNQYFRIQVVSGGYQIVDSNSNKCLNVAGASTQDGAAIQLATCNAAAASQVFNFIARPRGFYQIENLNSGKCLAISGSSLADAAPLVQLTCGAADNDKFYVSGTADTNPTHCRETFCGYYYDNMNLTELKFARNDAYPLAFNWGLLSPDPRLDPETFSIYHQGHFTFAAGTYTFTVTADDGVRVLVDGVVVIDAYVDQSATTYTATRAMTAGVHKVEVYYYDNIFDATLSLSWGL